jgi:hypothetical protein
MCFQGERTLSRKENIPVLYPAHVQMLPPLLGNVAVGCDDERLWAQCTRARLPASSGSSQHAASEAFHRLAQSHLICQNSSMRLRSRKIHTLQSSVGFVCDGRIVGGNPGDKTDRCELVGFQSKKEAVLKEHLLERAVAEVADGSEEERSLLL